MKNSRSGNSGRRAQKADVLESAQKSSKMLESAQKCATFWEFPGLGIIQRKFKFFTYSYKTTKMFVEKVSICEVFQLRFS